MRNYYIYSLVGKFCYVFGFPVVIPTLWLTGTYGKEKLERLTALKNEYDPRNLFRLNQNIKPTV